MSQNPYEKPFKERPPTEIEYPADKLQKAKGAETRFNEAEAKLMSILEELTTAKDKGDGELADKLIVEVKALKEKLVAIVEEIKNLA